MSLPAFPRFEPIVLDMRAVVHPLLAKTPDGVSEYTFSNLYLFRHRYDYRISIVNEKIPIISGRHGTETFFMTPYSAPRCGTLMELFETYDYWKCIPDSVLFRCRACLECHGIDISEDRNNFDYLYLRTNLATLPGKKYHKKRNLVKGFENSYRCEQKPLTPTSVPDALEVLEQWRTDKEIDGDYAAAREALELLETLQMRGAVYYIDGEPVAWCLGEELARGKMFAIHFEKALERYRGLYQFVNRSFSASLPGNYRFINREQDLGDEGLRQAKMSYRPSGFVRKYRGHV